MFFNVNPEAIKKPASLSQAREVTKYMCVKDIDFASFYEFDIWCWTVYTVWYLASFIVIP